MTYEHDIFLSYSRSDGDVARRIANELMSAGLSVWFAEQGLSPGDSIVRELGKRLSSSKYIMVLLSKKSVKSEWLQSELGIWFNRELRARDISIIPVLVEDCEIPTALKSIARLDLRKEGTIKKFIEQVKGAVEVDFNQLDGRSFEQMVGDLLGNLGFFNVKYRVAAKQIELDIVAESSHKDPFGDPQIEHWFVETKLYRHERPSIRAIHEVLVYLDKMPEYRALLVTSGQLTSAAK